LCSGPQATTIKIESEKVAVLCFFRLNSDCRKQAKVAINGGMSDIHIKESEHDRG